MGGEGVENSEERLFCNATLEGGGLVPQLIPNLGHFERCVVVGLRVIRGEVARLLEQRWKGDQVRWYFSLRPHMLGRSVRCGMGARDDRKAGRRTDRLGVTTFIEHHFPSQLVQGRRSGQWIAVTAK